MKRTAIVLGTALALLLAACGESEDLRVTAKDVVDKCDSSSQLDLSSDEKSIEYDFRPGTESTEAIYNCLLKETSAPSSVDFEVQETRPVDGTKSTEWDGWKLLWSYDGKSSRMQFSEV